MTADETNSTITRTAAIAAERIIDRLRAEGSELVDDEQTAQQVRAQVTGIATIAMTRLAGGQNALRNGDAGRDDRDVSDAALGARRADAQVHPSVSLRAATVAFEEIYPMLLERADSQEQERAVLAASVLQEVIGGTLAAAAVGYVESLLARLSAAHLEERRSLARQLHDDTAQGLAAALRRLEVTPIPRQELREAIEQALSSTRFVALNLRQSVGERRIDEAVRAWLIDIGRTPQRITLQQHGSPRRLPAHYQEELFLITREAVINAMRHSEASRIDITIDWVRTGVTITVTDDGIGFEPSRTPSGRIGLLVAQERAEVINAQLTVDRGVRVGTTVTLTLDR